MAEQILNLNFEQLNRLYAETKTEPEILEKKIEHTKYVDEYKISEEIREKYTKLGENVIKNNQYAVVTMAGGQGTRLGYDQPKGTVNIGIEHDIYIFECLMKNLMKVTDEAGVPVPLYIMTSVSNSRDTIEFFEEHKYFGYDRSYVKFFKQEMVPTVDFKGRVLMASETELAMAPNGNGGWFSSMVVDGMLEDVHKRGIEWINVFAVDNVLQQIADPLFIGATLASAQQSFLAVRVERR